MGLDASQARLLVLTSRKSDIELRVQNINNRRMAITYQLESVAKKYSDGIANRKLIVNSGGMVDELSLTSIQQAYGGEVKVFARSGGAVDPKLDSQSLQEGLKSGIFFMSYYETAGNVDTPILNNDGSSTFNWRTNAQISDVLDESDDEVVMAEYELASVQLQGQDKRLELELKDLDTQHKEIETEYDSVKKVIDKNIEGSFKTFS